MPHIETLRLGYAVSGNPAADVVWDANRFRHAALVALVRSDGAFGVGTGWAIPGEELGYAASAAEALAGAVIGQNAALPYATTGEVADRARALGYGRAAANSVVTVLPTITPPALRIMVTIGASLGGMWPW